MRLVRWFVVWALVNLCGALDLIPVFRRGEDGWHWAGSQWGCYPFHLASLSAKLDERWDTGVWEPIPDDEEG